MHGVHCDHSNDNEVIAQQPSDLNEYMLKFVTDLCRWTRLSLFLPQDEQEVQQVLDSEDFYEEDHPDEDDPHNTQLSMIRSLIEDSDAEDEDERPWLRKSDLEEDEDQENEDEDDENGVRPDRTRMVSLCIGSMCEIKWIVNIGIMTMRPWLEGWHDWGNY